MAGYLVASDDPRLISCHEMTEFADAVNVIDHSEITFLACICPFNVKFFGKHFKLVLQVFYYKAILSNIYFVV